VADLIYDHFKNQILAGSDIWTSANVKALLVDNSTAYVPAQAHNFLSDAKAASPVLTELSTGGYTARGTALASKALTRDDGNNRIKIQAANVTWNGLGPTSGGPTIRAVLLYIDTGTDSTSELIAYLDSGGLLTVNGGNVTLQFNATVGGPMTLS
jgi:hypothetical protein